MIQASLFSQVSGVQAQTPSVSYSNSSGEGSHAGIQSSVVRHGTDMPSCKSVGLLNMAENDSGLIATLEHPYDAGKQVSSPATTEQLPDICRRRHGGNAQSEAANVRVHPSKSELKKNILNFIRDRVGSTTEEVATGLNLRYTTASGRISELRRDSALEDSGKTRPTSSGCAATVWTTKGTL